MKKPSGPGGKRGQRKPILAMPTSSTKLYAEDYKTVDSLTRSWGETPAGVLRLIVHDWLRMQRVRAMGRDEASEEVRGVYERVVSEQVAPLAAGILELKALMGKRQPTTAPTTSAHLPLLEEGQVSHLAGMIESLRRTVEQAASDLAESGATQLDQLERVVKLLSLSNALAGENFAVNWSVRDWVIRYLVEVEMLSHDRQPDAVAEAVSDEKMVLWREARGHIALVEDDLGVGEDDHVTLSEHIAAGAQQQQSAESLHI
ncbi:MAG: hypothetical protein ACJ74Q_15720 [Pyrinomonadaceae bacterium]